jgi:hypothetical protein
MKRSWLSLVVGTAYTSAAGSVLIGIVWVAQTPISSWFEPVVQTLGVVACLSGVLVERRATARDRRRLAMSAFQEELVRGASMLEDPRFRPRAGASLRPYIYPRLPLSALDTLLTLGVLTERRDIELLRRLHGWREAANGFNRRLDLTELRLFTVGLDKEVGEFDRALHSDNGYLIELRHEVSELLDYLGIAAKPVPTRIKDGISRWGVITLATRRRLGRGTLRDLTGSAGQAA